METQPVVEPVTTETTTNPTQPEGEQMKVDPWTVQHVNYDKLVEV